MNYENFKNATKLCLPTWANFRNYLFFTLTSALYVQIVYFYTVFYIIFDTFLLL